MNGGNDKTMGREAAAQTAVEALTFLAADAGRMGGFLSLTGTAPDDIRARIDTPVFQAAVLDYLLQDERLLMAFARESGRDPASIKPQRHLLSGGPIPNR